MLDLGVVQSFWGPEQDSALSFEGIPALVDFVDLMPSKYGQLNYLAMTQGESRLKSWKDGNTRIKGLQGFFYGTDSSLSIGNPGFSSAQEQVLAACVLAGYLNAEFLILGAPSSRVLTEAISELEIRSGYLDLSSQAMEGGVPLLIENLPTSFDRHGLSSVQSLIEFAREGHGLRDRIGFCLDLGNHFSYHPGDRIRAFSEASELLETGLVRHLQLNLIGPTSLDWCLDFLMHEIDLSALNLGLAIEIPDAGFDAGLSTLREAVATLRPAVSSSLTGQEPSSD